MRTFKVRLARNIEERRKEVAKRLKTARLKRKLSQSLVAEALGFSCQADIAKIEKGGGKRGGRQLDVVELENFAKLYGLSLDHFATWQSQIASDFVSHGTHYVSAMRQEELQQQLTAIKEQRARTRSLKRLVGQREKGRLS